MSRQLAELLVKDKIITGGQFQEANEAAKSGTSYVRYLIERKHLAENKLLYYLCQKFGLPSINMAKFKLSPDVIQLVPGEVAKRAQAIAIQVGKGTLVVAMCDPTAMAGVEDLKFRAQMNVDVVLTPYSAF